MPHSRQIAPYPWASLERLERRVALETGRVRRLVENAARLPGWRRWVSSCERGHDRSSRHLLRRRPYPVEWHSGRRRQRVYRHWQSCSPPRRWRIARARGPLGPQGILDGALMVPGGAAGQLRGVPSIGRPTGRGALRRARLPLGHRRARRQALTRGVRDRNARSSRQSQPWSSADRVALPLVVALAAIEPPSSAGSHQAMPCRDRAGSSIDGALGAR
jgi:hypothetical protein